MSRGHQVWHVSLVNHGGMSAHDILNVTPGAVEVSLEEGLAKKDCQIFPVLVPGVNQDVVHLELVGELLGLIFQGGPHEQVILLTSDEYQGHISLVLWVPQYLQGNLHEGG